MSRTSADKARQHAKHAHYCTCSRIVFGNGGKASHAYMHEQRNDGYGFTTATVYREMFPDGDPIRNKARAAWLAKLGGV